MTIRRIKIPVKNNAYKRRFSDSKIAFSSLAPEWIGRFKAVTANPNDRSALDALKASVDLIALFETHGVAVRRLGRSFKALCPFHEEKTPSLSVDPKKGLWKCFGCGKGGDHVTFLELRLNLPFKEALQVLGLADGQCSGAGHALNSALVGGLEVGKSLAPGSEVNPRTPAAWQDNEMMERVAEVWHQAFCQRPEGLAYLESRGLHDKEMLRLLQAGYCDGEQILAIGSAEEQELLQRVGILNERGKEFFSRCVVFPLKDRHGRVVGFYGRSTLSGAKVPHRFCAGTATGLFYPQAARGASEVILVEGVLDALALYQAGFPNVMAMGGTQGLTAAILEHLKLEKVRKLVLCLDGDGPGQAATAELSIRLKAEGFSVRAVSLPDTQDPLSCLADGQCEAGAASELCAALAAQLSTAGTESSNMIDSDRAHEPSARTYRKLSSAQGKLKVLVSVTEHGEKAEATVDLYSSRSRRQEALNLARRLSLHVQDIEDWLFSVLNELEALKGTEEPAGALFGKVEVPEMTARQRETALEFLSRPDLIERILADMESLGYMGEEEAKLLGYCVSVSRKLSKPMSAIIQSGSGAGKSYLAQIIHSLTPPEDVVFYSRLSQQALYHMPKDYLVHKLVELEERAGGEGCDYQIRSLQSAHKLVQAIVVKDPATGQLFTKENEVLGPIAYIETTTNLRLNPENTSRCFEIPLDESPEQTRRIHERQKALKGLERLSAVSAKDAICQRHHHAQRLLEAVEVVIPYVHLLTFPDQWLRSRRDHDRYLHLIEVLAYLHQHQRPRKSHQGVDYIEATVQDYRWAYFLASRILRGSMDELTRWARELLVFFEAQPSSYTRREVRECLQWPDRRTREALEELTELEYLEVLRGSNNLQTFRLSPLTATNPCKALGLLHPDELEARWGSV